jgi:hypothetical protein
MSPFFRSSGNHGKGENIRFVGLPGSFILTKCLNGIGSRLAQIVERADQESILKARSGSTVTGTKLPLFL